MVPQLGVAYEPVFLYEMIWDIAVFAVLWWLRPRFRIDGQLFALYLALYAIGKFALSFFRTETVWFAGLQEAQLLSIAALALAALWAWWRARPARVPSAHEAMRAHRDFLDALTARGWTEVTFDPDGEGRSDAVGEGQTPVRSSVMATDTALAPNASPARPSRLLVVDDDENVTNMLRRALSFEGYAVATARDGNDALKKTLEFAPDLVVLDIMMPGIDGVEVARRLRAGDPQLAILMLTAKDAPADQVVGLDAGADDYLVKPFTLEVLTARVRALLRRKEPNETEVLRFGDLALDTGTRSARRGSREIALTTTEYELLLQFLRHPRQVLEKEQLTEKVWGYDFGGNYNVLEVYVRYLRQKLEATGESRLIHTLRGAGYVLREPAA